MSKKMKKQDADVVTLAELYIAKYSSFCRVSNKFNAIELDILIKTRN